MTTHKTAPATMMAVLILRALVGASSRLSQPSQSESIGRASTNVALIELFLRTLYDRNRGRAHAEKIRVGIFDFDANREALVRRGREINDRFDARSHMSNFRCAKIRDNVPFARVEQREDRNPGGNMGAGRNVEIDDTSGKRCDDLAVGEVEFLEVDGGHHTFALSL